MSTSSDTPRASSAKHKAGRIHVEFEDGRAVDFPITASPRLAAGKPRQLNNIEISPFGLHWPDLDEDLSLRGILAGRFGPTHGGRRTGAGRKPTDHVRMQLSVKPATRKRLQSLAKKNGTTVSAVVDALV
jgi:hypothetical protein